MVGEDVESLLGVNLIEAVWIDSDGDVPVAVFTAEGGRDGWLWLEHRDNETIAHLSMVVAEGDLKHLRSTARRLPTPLVGELDVVDESPAVLRNVYRFALDDSWPFRERLSRLHRQAAMLEELVLSPSVPRGHRARQSLLNALAEVGIAPPPDPPSLRPRLWAPGPWWWSSTTVEPVEMYLFSLTSALVFGWNRAPLFAFSHAGHGLNSYGLNLLVADGPLAAFVQHGWGGVYMEPVSHLEEIASTYARLHVIFSGLAGEPGPARFLLLHSTFRGDLQLIDLQQASTPEGYDGRIWPPEGTAVEVFADESEMFAATAAKFPEANFFGAVPPEW